MSVGSPDARTSASRSAGGFASAASNSAPTRSQRSASLIRAASSALQPRARERPVALHGRRRDVERFGRFLDRQPAEVAQLDDLGLTLVERGQPLERGVEREEVDLAGPPLSARRGAVRRA